MGAWQTFKEKIGQGAQELANALYSGQAYMPWQGTPKPTLTEEATHQANLQEATDGILQNRAEAREAESPATASEQHQNLYVSPDSAHRAQYQNREQSRGMER